MTTVITTAIDVTTLQTTVEIGIWIECYIVIGNWGDFRSCRGTDGVPLQGRPIRIPAHGLYLQSCEVHFQLVADGSFGRTFRYNRLTQQTTQILCIETRLVDIGIVTSAYDFIIYIDGFIEVEGGLTRYFHTTHITAAEE